MKKYRKPFNDDTENHTLRLFDYATGEISGSNPFSDLEERERIRAHAKNRLNGFLCPKNQKMQKKPNFPLHEQYSRVFPAGDVQSNSK